MQLLQKKDEWYKFNGWDHMIYSAVPNLLAFLFLPFFWHLVVWGGARVYWLLVEVSQEKKMVKEDPTRKFSLSEDRKQDMFWPALGDSIILALRWVLF